MHIHVPTAAPTAPILPADDAALIPLRLLMPIVGLRKSAIYSRIADGRFPTPVKLSGRCARWRSGDTREFLRDPMGWSPEKAMDAPSMSGGAA